jgi:lantibiotic biosynthesis protein
MPGQHTQAWVPDPQFVMRTPLLPLSAFTAWAGRSDGNGYPTTGDPTATVHRWCERLRKTLRDWIDVEYVREALFVASPALCDGLAHWRANPDSTRGQKVERALVRYLARMAGRSTPFGLFSGISSGHLGDETRLALAPHGDHERHTRLDNDYLFSLTEALGRDPAVRDCLTYRPNSSLCQLAGGFRYAEARVVDGQRTYHLVEVEPTDYLERTLVRARPGASRAQLALALAQDNDVTPAEAEAFIDELIDAQLLVSALTPAVTGVQPLEHVLATLRQCEAKTASCAVLADVERALAAIDDAGLGAPTDAYRAVANQLRALPVPVELSRLFQVDLVKPAATATIGRDVLAELQRGLGVLGRIGSSGADDSLRRFRDAFLRRYEQREVPLVEALDEEIGIGFDASHAPAAQAAPLLSELRFPRGYQSTRVPGGPRERCLVRLLHEALASGRRELRLTDRDIEELAQDESAPLPDAIGVVATIIAASADDIARGDFKVALSSCHGPSGARLSGRFCHASSDILAGVHAHLRAEEALHPQAIFAEVVHLPEGRIGNVVCRPLLRSYEIPFLGHAGAPASQTTPVQDLLVSVRGSRIVLRSRRFGREVIPRLTTAHNFYRRSVGMYRFLCALQSQDGAGASWSWGPADDAPFVPRVTYGRLVFARARWLLAKSDLEPLAEASRGSGRATTESAIRRRRARVFAAAQQLRERRGLPRFVQLADDDNELPVDFANPLSVDSFVHLVRSRSRATLFELFPNPDELVVTGPEGAFTHQLLLSFTRDREPTTTDRAHRPQQACTRRFAPGSEWLYAKLYCGTATADRVLCRAIFPLAQHALGSGLAAQWFFLRYADPDPHIRVRFRGDPGRLCAELLPALYDATASFIDRGSIWRIDLGTYEREVERYGGAAGIKLAEKLFWIDSEAVLAALSALRGDEGAQARWRLALFGADLLLDDFGLSTDEKLALVRGARDDFAREFRADAMFLKQLGAKYRLERATLLDLFNTNDDRDPARPLATGFAAFARRSERVRSVLPHLRAAEQRGELCRPVNHVAWDFVHMHLNRMLGSAQRAQELVIYDFLRRLYQTHRAETARCPRRRGASTRAGSSPRNDQAA